MKVRALILIGVLTMCGVSRVCLAADENLQTAILTQEMLLDIGKYGVAALEKFADAKNIAALKKTIEKGGEMADVAQRTLKILEAYNDGVRGDELKKLVTREVGDYAYGKIKAKTMDYIKSKVTTVGELTAAYDLLGTLHDTSYYITYIGMSIGLDMMDEATVRKLEQSGFTKAAEKITELKDKIMSDAKAGYEELKEKFLAETEGSFIDRFASSVTKTVSTIWENAKEGARDIGGRISNWLFGPDEPDEPQPTTKPDEPQPTTEPTEPPGSDIVSPDSTPGGDQVISGQDDGGSDNVCPIPPEGDSAGGNAPLPPMRYGGNDDICYPEDDSAGGDAASSPQTGRVPDAGSYFGGLNGYSLPDFGALLNELAGSVAVVGPNLPYQRVLWAFSGESLAEQGLNLLRNPSSVSDFFGNIGDYIDEMKAAIQKITGIGN